MFKIETIVDSCNECPYMMYQGGMAEHHYCNEILGSFIPPDKLDVIQEWCPYTQWKYSSKDFKISPLSVLEARRSSKP